MNAHRYLLIVAAVAAVSAAGCEKSNSKGKGKSSTATKVADNAPKLEMYVMSQCPYGTQVVDAVAAARNELGASAIDLDIQFIGKGAGDQLSSMHGPSEVAGNIAQLCAMELAPDTYLDMLVCQNKNMRTVDTNWKECAPKANIDVDALGKCIEGSRGKELLTASFANAQARGAQSSPTIFLGGKPYAGGRKPRDFMRAVCDATDGDKPKVCGNIPEPPVVNAIFLSDARCAKCDLKALEPKLKGVLGGLVVEHVDYGTDRGKELYAQMKAASPQFKNLPAVLIGPEVKTDTDGYPEIQRFLKPAGDYLELAVGGQFDPTAEICDNGGVDDDGDGQADCKDSDCTEQMACRPEQASTLDLFVMSQCPYGAKAMIAADQMADHFGEDLNLRVHFIGSEQDGKLTSMHGQAEVDEDMREACAAAEYPKNHQYMDYLACRSQDYRNDNWQPCAEKAGMDAARIQACFDGKGKDILAKSFAHSEKLGMSASPTLLANNRRQFNAVDAASMQRQYCQDNPNLAGCKTPIAPGALDPVASPGAAQAPAEQCN